MFLTADHYHTNYYLIDNNNDVNGDCDDNSNNNENINIKCFDTFDVFFTLSPNYAYCLAFANSRIFYVRSLNLFFHAQFFPLSEMKFCVPILFCFCVCMRANSVKETDN